MTLTAVIWPAAVLAYLGGLVVTARRLYASGWTGTAADPFTRPFTRGESLFVSLAWPIWVPLLYGGKLARATWRLAIRGVFGDVGQQP